MWRWPVVQARKDAVNFVKWKIFSLHAKLIAVAASKWWNPDDNPALFAAIHKAKKEWVPNDNIERAIKKGTWEDKSAAAIQEVVYEWYAPGWVAVMVTTLTDNKNRTVSSIRHTFTKYWWNLWENWVVSWMFHRKWVIFIDPGKYDYEKIEELVFETNAEDIEKTDSYIKVITSADDFNEIEKYLESKGIDFIETKLDFVPDNDVEITDFDNALKFKKMIEAFDEDEDVSLVSSNEIISPELERQVDEFVEKNKFRT